MLRPVRAEMESAHTAKVRAVVVIRVRRKGGGRPNGVVIDVIDVIDGLGRSRSLPSRCRSPDYQESELFF